MNSEPVSRTHVQEPDVLLTTRLPVVGGRQLPAVVLDSVVNACRFLRLEAEPRNHQLSRDGEVALSTGGLEAISGCDRVKDVFPGSYGGRVSL